MPAPLRMGMRSGMTATAAAFALLVLAQWPKNVYTHDSYGVCELYQCRCDNASLSLDCRDGHDLTVHSLLRLPRSYKRIAIDEFLVAEVLDGGELATFTDLSELRLTRCRIERVGEAALAGLGRLRVLSLSGNHIQRLTVASLKDLGTGGLVDLDLSHNLLEELDPGLFDGFGQLRTLDLSGNKLRRLPATGAFDSLRSLRRLDLSSNELAYVFPRTFVNLTALEMLNLQRNLLVTVQETLLVGKPLLRTASFGGNPLECNCGVQWLRDRLRRLGESGNGSLPTLCMSDGVPLVSKTDSELRCMLPAIETVSAPLRTYQRNSFRLFCNASGRPKPAVVWRLPCGDYLADPEHGEWLHDAMHTFYGSRTYYITATADELTFSVSRSSGGHELLVSSLRRFSEGTYTCIAVSPAGNVSTEVEVAMVAPIADIYVPSLIFGAGATSGGTLLVGALGCVIQRACRNRRKRKCRKRAAARAGSQRASLLGSTSGMSTAGYGCSADVTTATADGCQQADDATGVIASVVTESLPEPGPSDSLLRTRPAAAAAAAAAAAGCSYEDVGYNIGDDDDGDSDDEEEDDDVYGSEYEESDDEAAAAESYDAFAVGAREEEDSELRRQQRRCDVDGGDGASTSNQQPSDCRPGRRARGSRTREALVGMKLKLRSPPRGDRMDTMERLRLNMEKKAERVKVKMEKRAERMRTNMERHRERMRDTLLNIRESTSHSLQSIRDTSSSYAHKLHAGVRNAMENVGYTVQSLKELCGAGDLGLTMSVATIATNVDTDEQVQVVRNVTRV